MEVAPGLPFAPYSRIDVERASAKLHVMEHEMRWVAEILYL